MFYKICLFVLALLFYEGETQECPNGFIYFPNGSKCYYVFPDRVTWDEAFNTCNQHGSHLAAVKNADTTAALRSMIAQSRGKCPHFGLWTAGRRDCKNCLFKWSTGCSYLWPIEYNNWQKGEPNNSYGNENCIVIYDDGKWNDVDCAQYRCSICEIDI